MSYDFGPGISFLVSLVVGGAFQFLPILSPRILRVLGVVLASLVFLLMVFGDKFLFPYVLGIYIWFLLQMIYYMVFLFIQYFTKKHLGLSLKMIVFEVVLIFVFTTLAMFLISSGMTWYGGVTGT